MKKLIVSTFLVLSSFSILDTEDPKKVMIVISYENTKFEDKLLVNRSDLGYNNHNIVKIVEEILKQRKAY